MKFRCQERRCNWVGEESEILYFQNPYNESEKIGVCPECRTIETSIWQACDEQGCNRTASCGVPTPEGYRNTCYDHMPVKVQK